MNVTSKDLIAALRRHHEPPPSKPTGGVLLVEVQSPNAGRRADALWVPANTALRGTLVGYEVKVSRADVVQELRDPMKADAWEQHCDRWWLVIPNAALIDGLDVPERWGVMTPPTAANRRTMSVIRQAKSTGRQPTAAAWAEVIAKMVYGGEDLQTRLAHAERRLDAWQKRYDALDEEVRMLRRQGALLPHDEQDIMRKARDVVAAVEHLAKHDPNFDGVWTFTIEAEQIARNILAAEAHRRATDYHESRIDQLRRDIERLTRAATALAEVGDS